MINGSFYKVICQSALGNWINFRGRLHETADPLCFWIKPEPFVIAHVSLKRSPLPLSHDNPSPSLLPVPPLTPHHHINSYHEHSHSLFALRWKWRWIWVICDAWCHSTLVQLCDYKWQKKKQEPPSPQCSCAFLSHWNAFWAWFLKLLISRMWHSGEKSVEPETEQRKERKYGLWKNRH